MKKILFSLLIALVFSCAYDYQEFSWDIDYDFEGADLSTPKKIHDWVIDNIKYRVPDNVYNNPVLSPQETLNKGYGNCKTFVVLMAAIEYNLNGNKSTVISVGNYEDDKTHLVWKAGGKHYHTIDNFNKFLYSVDFDRIQYDFY